jgi:predicted RNA-binding Zn ribbon-like protein
MVVMKSANELDQRLDLVVGFVNTFDLETGVDQIATPDELGEWLADNELTDDLVEPTPADVAEAARLRDAIRVLLLEHNGEDVDADQACTALEEAARKTHVGLRFRAGRSVLEPEGDDAAAAIGRLVATVAELTGTNEWQRLKACRDDTCRQAFYDQSRNRSRAWCSMEVCGNRDKQRSFRGRHAH